MSRCVTLSPYDFADEASSIVTSGCVILYDYPCCQGATLEVKNYYSDLGDYHDFAGSISPCGEFRSEMPESIHETWLGHTENMTKFAENGDIAVYYNDAVHTTALRSHRDILNKVWNYVKENYGKFGPDGGRLSVFMHANVSGPTYGFNSIQNYFDEDSDCRNLIDVTGDLEAWSTPLSGVELDIVVHEIAHIVEGASKGIHESPSYGLWGDSKWAEIFMYDVYSSLGYTQERDRVHEMWTNSADNFPKPGTHWFRDWFFPIWRDCGGVQVLDKYFELLAKHYPKEPGQKWKYRAGAVINLGEFVHFFSGAAGRNLVDQAKIAFQWDSSNERDLWQARRNFPGVRYDH